MSIAMTLEVGNVSFSMSVTFPVPQPMSRMTLKRLDKKG